MQTLGGNDEGPIGWVPATHVRPRLSFLPAFADIWGVNQELSLSLTAVKPHSTEDLFHVAVFLGMTETELTILAHQGYLN